MTATTDQNSFIVFGFDSAWMNNPKAPGAICSVAFATSAEPVFREPILVSFAGALEVITSTRNNHARSIVAIDQPTIVPNQTGSRPVDKVAASLVSYVGGGVQPASRSKTGMFCDNAPIWSFLRALNATQDPFLARTASAGHYAIEVFPALALPALAAHFARRSCAPKYNPTNRRKFRPDNWRSVVDTVTQLAERLAVTGMRDWARGMRELDSPQKADQDKLDSVICALIGLQWCLGPAGSSAVLGDLECGYIVTPVSPETSPRLKQAATKYGVSYST